MDALDHYRVLQDLCRMTEDVALESGLRICVTVIDQHGNLVLVHRMPGSSVVTIALAERKAYTSMALGIDTSDLQALIQPGGPLRTLPLEAPLVAVGGGGVLSLDDGAFFGVGVSGGPDESADIELLDRVKQRFTAVTWAREPRSS